MNTNDVIRENILSDEIKDILRNEIQATNEELNSLEKLLQISQEQTDLSGGSRLQPSIIINQFLYHGDLGHAIDMELLLDLQIEHIINLCDCTLDEQIQNMFDVIWIENLEDHYQGNIREHFDRINSLLEEYRMKNERVLVHCQAGISRSSTIILAYLIRHHPYNLEQAYRYLLDRRPIIAPNYGFLIQLIRYDKELDQIKTLQQISLHNDVE